MGNAVAEVISLVRERPGISSGEIAERLGVSTRTVRTRIRHANDLIAGAGKISYRRTPAGDGYYLDVVDSAALEAARARLASRHGEAPQGSEERISYLVDDLLARSDWVTLDVLADILYVSRASISADLKQVERILEAEGLALERRPRYGIRVCGPELSRRSCLAKSATSSEAGAGAASILSQRLMLDAVSVCVERGLAEGDFAVNSASYQNVIVHVAIALLRAAEGCPPRFEGEALERIRRSDAYATALRIAGHAEGETGVHLPEEEVAYIAIHLAGRQVIAESERESASNAEGGLVISSEVWGVVEKMLDAVWETYRFELRDDLELRMNLARHVTPLSVRLRYNIAMSNPLLDEIKSTYPFAYSMAVEASTVLSDEFGVAPSDDEIGYIALSFALALERKNSMRPKKNVLVVCGSGMASAQLLAMRLRRSFGPYLGDVELCEVGGLRTRDLSNVDYVFSTVPVPYELRVPLLTVSLLLDERDCHAVERVLKDGGSDLPFEEHYRRELFFSHLDAADKRELIHVLCEWIRSHESVDGDFERLVCEREQLAPASFGNGVALPHPIRPASEKTFVCVALLDRPIPWNGHAVDAVFLLSIAKNPQGDLQDFYKPLTRLLLSEASMGRLLSERTYESLIRELRGGEQDE